MPLDDQEKRRPGDVKHGGKLQKRADDGKINLKIAYPMPNMFYDTVTRTLYVGAAWDGYFTGDDLVEQTKAAVEAFKKKYGHEKIGVFIFDNATNHGTLPPDALHASWLNKGDSCDAKNKKAPSRDGWYFNDKGERTVQKMNT